MPASGQHLGPTPMTGCRRSLQFGPSNTERRPASPPATQMAVDRTQSGSDVAAWQLNGSTCGRLGRAFDLTSRCLVGDWVRTPPRLLPSTRSKERPVAADRTFVVRRNGTELAVIVEIDSCSRPQFVGALDEPPPPSLLGLAACRSSPSPGSVCSRIFSDNFPLPGSHCGSWPPRWPSSGPSNLTPAEPSIPPTSDGPAAAGQLIVWPAQHSTAI
jgi:hypothetical protein